MRAEHEFVPTVTPIVFFMCRRRTATARARRRCLEAETAPVHIRVRAVTPLAHCRPAERRIVDGCAIGRSWPRKRSAIAPSRSRASASSKHRGSSERLPLVATSGRPTESSSNTLQRRIGKQCADPWVAWRDRLREWRIGPAANQARSAQPSRLVISLRHARSPPSPAAKRAREHHRERFFLAVFAEAEFPHPVSFAASTIR